MKFKSGDMVVIVGATSGYEELVGRIVTLNTPSRWHDNSWFSDPVMYVHWSRHPVSLHEDTLRLIKGGDLQVTDDLELPEPALEK